MADEFENRATRLTGGKGKRVNTPALAAVALITGLSVGGAGVYYALTLGQRSSGPAFPTSDSREFQTSGSTGLRTVDTDPTFGPAQDGPTETERALQARVAELERLLKDAEAPRSDAEQLNALRGELDGLKSELDKQSSEMRGVALERDELQRELSRQEAETAGLMMRLEQAGSESLAEQQRLEEEARRRDELEQRRAEAAAVRERQINSPIGGISGGGSDREERDYAGDEAFLRAGADRVKATQSQIIGAPSNTIIQGTVIEATITTGINSELSGTIASTVSYDIWSFDMSRVLVPRGSQLFGRYSNEVALGQRRVLVAWDRIVTPDGQVAALDAYGSDRLGRSGLTGKVNNRFGQRFGAAALISVLGALPILAASGSDSELASDVAEDVSDDVQDNVSSVVEEYLKLAPIITVEHGSVINIMVTNDLELF